MEYLTVAETAERLGVKRETVYAYASRGLLTSVRGAQRRGSRFAQDEVEALAARGREAGEPSGTVERIRTRITLVADGGPWFRGVAAPALAGSADLEQVAALLWEVPGRVSFDAAPDLLAPARAVLDAAPAGARATDRFRLAVAAVAAADPLRAAARPGAVVATASALLGTVVTALAGDPGSGPSDLAERLLPALLRDPGRAPASATAGHVRAALVLLADHGLASSTVAARVAASTLADVHAVVSAGLGALDGPRHGLVSGLAHRFLTEAQDDPSGVLAQRLRAGERVPGFGHSVYRGTDPRTTVLLDRLRADPAADRVVACVDAVVAGMDRGGDGPAPNVDLALAALMHAHDLSPDAGELLFACARTVGWVAHALEEYAEPGLRFRPTGVYTGPRPGSTSEASTTTLSV
ncbi:Citrate synthase (si) [Pseudonocardia sp. Ae717_Ps2]|uniref:citrate synthase n=1 Tax=Pseudonocardia sp. Ae717_Ps2 TaxID=1885573 RepID=UPI0009688A84|nr:citrate synthase [Pseudonocardia sp. Ae717_Ps2]OLM30027.1 Citrate synthase (si) [Pseudonocardia sp. Ae717_Ps2]